MINFSMIECVGCTACASICPKNIICMKKNEEGFQQPHIEEKDSCIECGLCERVCPILNNQKETKNNHEIAYIVQNKDTTIRKESASGGMFSAIAMSVLKKGGVVYGAAYDSDYTVRHVRISEQEELWRLRNSKYVQSNLDGVFQMVKKDLIDDRQVCFSGTPCQVEGIKCYLGREYKNLLLVDFVCHGVSSPLIWEKYLETVKKYRPENIYFRWKYYGYKYSTMSVFDKDKNEVYFSGVETDKMLRAYFTNNCDRESCYNCKFKKRYRQSDLTMWDCFQPRFFNKQFDDDLGTSCVLINSKKGRKQFERIKQMHLLNIFQVNPDELTKGNNELVNSVKRGTFRDTILFDATKMEAEELFEKYFPDTVMQRLKKALRILLIKTKLYSFVKYIIYSIRRKKS